ncbi:MAG: 4-(cytidine 5'-diphospho)-2-C-methyl-D-erythritol kinase [Bacteroidetes bacterium]|nr:MAG: 4-(cytidine 5'-diphospho)-2-C-methyl-D-erythritol kinase [Bacteroidota bacterium]
MSDLYLRPHAKVNLGLLIKGKRSDGYHLLETLFYPVYDLQDELWLRPSSQAECTLELDGNPLDGDVSDNLCVKAWRALRARVPDLPGVHLRLTKHIPAGAGLGGGSSDAAFTLRGLNTLFDLGLDTATLAEIGARLGADVPFFLHDRPLIARGIGTEFEAIDFTLPGELRVFPQDLHSSTIAAYKALDYRRYDPARELKSLLAQPLEAWRHHLPNDLEDPVFELYPQLQGVKEQLYAQGAKYAAMSGSGSAFFGIF